MVESDNIHNPNFSLAHRTFTFFEPHVKNVSDVQDAHSITNLSALRYSAKRTNRYEVVVAFLSRES